MFACVNNPLSQWMMSTQCVLCGYEVGPLSRIIVCVERGRESYMRMIVNHHYNVLNRTLKD